MQRRDFLRDMLSGATAAGLAGRALAGAASPIAARGGVERRQGQATNPVLVVIYLRGAQDALNTIIPYADPRYYEIRPTIAISPKSGAGEKGVVRLNKRWGLHPAMASLLPVWKAGKLAPIVCVGSPHPTRSHFDAQDFMEYAAPGLRTSRDGWLNRYLALTADRSGSDSPLRALAMQGLLPRSLRGKYPVLAVPERGGRRAARYLDLFDDLYMEPGAKQPAMASEGTRREDPVVRTGHTTITTLRRYQTIVGRAKKGKQHAVRYPRGRLGSRLGDIAKVIQAGEPLEVACVDWNGWDHHTGEGGEDGRMARMLSQVSDSIAAFLRDLGPAAERTVVVTMTEFGRTCRENGNMGTDHGHGGAMLLAGGPVAGGKVYGRFPGLRDRDMYQGRDLVVTTDFRDVMAELIVRHMGVKKLPKDFFPDFNPSRKPLGILG